MKVSCGYDTPYAKSAMSRTKNEGKLQRSILQAIHDLPGEPTTQEIAEAIDRRHATGWGGGRYYSEEGVTLWEQSYRKFTADPEVYNCLSTLRDRGLVTGTFRGWALFVQNGQHIIETTG